MALLYLLAALPFVVILTPLIGGYVLDRTVDHWERQDREEAENGF